VLKQYGSGREQAQGRDVAAMAAPRDACANDK